MKKYLIILTILVSTNVFAWNQRVPESVQNCSVHTPYGFPQTAGVQAICRQAYFVGYDAQSKLPKYVTYTLHPQNALGCVDRTDAFVADKSVINGATPDDYVGTGYDKGHAVPAGDLSWDQQVEYESFLMTNMYPQSGSLNRGIWKLLETSIRGWAVQYNRPFVIYVGGIYNESNKKIGNNVTVPHYYYKIVIDNNTGAIAGWLFPHTAPYPNLGNDLTKFRVPVSEIMKLSGVIYSFPVNVNELPAGGEWQVDFGKLTQSKRDKCK
jgi:endonuclease G